MSSVLSVVPLHEPMADRYVEPLPADVQTVEVVVPDVCMPGEVFTTMVAGEIRGVYVP